MIKVTSFPKLKSPIMICAWPGMGEVAIKAGIHLKESLPFKEFAHLESLGYLEPSAVFVKNGVLEFPDNIGGIFYYCKCAKRNRDMILFLSDAQPNMGSGIAYAQEIIKFAEKQGVKFIYTFAAMTVPIDHAQESKVWIATSSRKIIHDFRPYNLKLLKDGQISGLNGIILGVAKINGIEGVCLLGEIPIYTIQIENPRASCAVLDVLDRHLGLGLTFTSLKERAKFVEEEINKLIGFIKGDVSPTAPLSEEDIERIKHELASFTKLPESARKKIEELFRDATQDLAKAQDLKKELDTWSVFKDYEDRFLDLFRKKKTD